MDTTLDSLFTVTSLLSLQGSAAAAVLVPNVIGSLVGEKFDQYRKWTSLAIALALAFLAAFMVDDGPLKWVVALFNGFLIFASAMGLNQLPRRNRSKVKSSDDDASLSLPKIPRFFKSWI
ncbi:MAG TPA: hypothetical protein H9902_06825 [Candidatus Stackebrandtia faecavium]|nr:hypothetical protein [Candidatus Stackebrandtia faecavium]